MNQKAETQRTFLRLDTDAAALLMQLAPSENKRGQYVSTLIRAAAKAPDQENAPLSVDPAGIRQQMLGFVRRGFQRAAQGRPTHSELAELQREAVRLAGSIAALAGELEFVLARQELVEGEAVQPTALPPAAGENQANAAA
ncbi:MAG: hypothetical protein M3Z04_01595 [Chloroflexota bacterium]|nr:hypothetical protein [Chloroflexota bacterium]